MHRLPTVREAAGGTRTAYRCGPSEAEGTVAGDATVSDARNPRAGSTERSARRMGEREERSEVDRRETSMPSGEAVRRSDDTRATPRVRYRCCGCGFEFAPALPGAAPCPRCGSIGGHEAIGRAGGVPDGG